MSTLTFFQIAAGRVAEQRLARRVEHQHFAAGSDQDDAVDRGLDHCP
jgi:hypothetical protein